MSLNSLVSSTGWKNFIAKLYGFGASIVIVGALFKIQHWPLAGMMLTVGLLTEAVIFFFSAFEPLHEEIDWTLVYPELAGLPSEEGKGRAADHHVSGSSVAPTGVPAGGVTAGIGGNFVYSGGGGGSVAALSKFDEMLNSAELSPDLLKNLGVGMKKLGEATANMNAMVDVSNASSKYLETVNSANTSLEGLAATYKSTTEVLNSSSANYQKVAEAITVIDEGGKSYQKQIEALNKNLAALNTAYELQKKGADDHVKESASLYNELQGLVKNLADSAEDTKKYRDQVTKLNDNLAALNNVYGNMLSAMNVK
jgi:gliding motility-associated protein GldL